MTYARLLVYCLVAASLLPCAASAASSVPAKRAETRQPYRCANPPAGTNDPDTLPPPATPYTGLLFGGGTPTPVSARLKKPTGNDENAYISYSPTNARNSEARAFFEFLFVDAKAAGTNGVTITGREHVDPTCSLTLFLHERTVNIVTNGHPTTTIPVKTDTPLLRDTASGEFLLPMRLVAEAFGATVVWCHPSLTPLKSPPPPNDLAKCYVRKVALMRHDAGATEKYIEAIYLPKSTRVAYDVSIRPPKIAVDPGTPVPYTVWVKPLIPPQPARVERNATVRVSSHLPTRTITIKKTVVTPEAGTPSGDFTITPIVSKTYSPISHTGTATLSVKQHELDVTVTPSSTYQDTDVRYTLTLKQTFPTPDPASTPDPPPKGSVSVSPAPGITPYPATMTLHVAPDAQPTTYTVTPVKDPTDTRNITIGPPATFSVLPTCHWEAISPVSVNDGSSVAELTRKLDPKVKFDHLPSGAPTPSPLPAPSLSPNPATLFVGTQVQAPPNATHTGTVGISGGYCKPYTAQVIVEKPSALLQHSVAVDYGRASVYDELSPGNDDWNKLLAHAELQVSTNAWLSVETRSIGYRHDARSTVPLACPPAPPAPAAGGAAAGDEGCVTVPGGASQTYRTAFSARDTSIEVRGGFALGEGAPVAELAYLTASNNAFRPSVSGLGGALEMPPALSKPGIRPYGAVSYFPHVSGGGISYHVFRYRGGVTYTFQPSQPTSLFLELAAVGDRRGNASNAPSSAVYQAVTFGLGLKF